MEKSVTNNERCRVHGAILQLMRVPVLYGLPVHDDAAEALIKARGALFPNSKTHVLGGCTLGMIGREIEELVCIDCRWAEKEWAEANDRDTEPQIGGMLIGGTSED